MYQYIGSTAGTVCSSKVLNFHLKECVLCVWAMRQFPQDQMNWSAVAWTPILIGLFPELIEIPQDQMSWNAVAWAPILIGLFPELIECL